MERIELTQEQKDDFSKSLIERIKAFFKDVFHSDKPLHGKELDEHLLSQTQSDAEKEALAELLDEIDTFHEKHKAYQDSGKDIVVWYDEEIERIVKSINPNSTLSEIDQVKEAVAKQIDDEVEITAQALEEMVNEVMRKEDKA